MIRSSRGLAASCHRMGIVSGILRGSSHSLSAAQLSTIRFETRFRSTTIATTIATTTKNLQLRPFHVVVRNLSTTKDGEYKQPQDDDKDKSKKTGSAGDNDEEDTKEIVLTPGEKVVAYSRLAMWSGIGLFAAACAYYIIKELFPTKMSPNRVFDASFEIVRKDPEVLRRYGDTVKGYGRDHGGHREGRRNFVEHTQYKNPEDGSNRTRVRYNLEGRFGMAFVFAEVSNQMPAGEFVYILVQDKSNGRVHTIIDNRAAMTAQRLAGGSQEAQSAMAQLLSGGKK